MTGEGPNDRRDIDTALSDEAIEWHVHLRSGRATAADHAAFDAWRRRSPAHDAAARETEALWRDIAETRIAAMHGQGREAAKAAISGKAFDQALRSRRKLSRRMVLTGGIAASLAIGAAGSGLLGPVSGIFADYATRTGQRLEVHLPDGSVALLNTATALSVHYSETERRLTLYTGEALFKVATEANRPFVVAAAAGEAQALGTVFTVRHDGLQVRVLVSEGVVEIRTGADRHSAKLEAGQQTSFGPDNRLTDPQPANIASATAWIRGKLVFNKRPLSEVVAELERYRAGRILIMDERLKDLQVSGVFDLDGPGEVLQTLEQILQVSVVRLPLLSLIR